MKKVLLIYFFVLFFGINYVQASTTFENYVNNPVFSYSAESGTFDQMRISTHDVIKVDDGYKMYYSGIGNGNSVQIGLATSQDGVEWTRSVINPIFKCSENTTSVCSQNSTWSSYRVVVVSVEYKDGNYTMWYQGTNRATGHIWHLGVARSQDGIIWDAEDVNPVLTAFSETGILYLSVLPLETGYRLYILRKSAEELYYTDSIDGIEWTGPVIKIGDHLVYSVDKVDDVFWAVNGIGDIATSSTGTNFDFSNTDLNIEINTVGDQSRSSFLSDGSLIKSWSIQYLGNVIWSYGNFGIAYATLDSLYPPVVNKYPKYTQNISEYPSVASTTSWAKDEYANGSAIGSCGSTISQCGCALTSWVMAARNIGIKKDILGGDVNPGNMNAYLNQVGGYTSYGALNWLAGQAYFGELTSSGIASRFTGVEFVRENQSVMQTIDNALASADKAVLAYKKYHFVWLPEKTENSYVVLDPSWYNTLTANDEQASFVRDYDNVFDEARIVKSSEEPTLLTGGNIEAHIRGTAELVFKNAVGQKVGYQNGEVVIDLDRATYGDTEIISIAGTEGDDQGRHLLVYGSGDEFTIEVIGTGSGEYSVEFFAISSSGEIKTFDFSGTTIPGLTTSFTVNLATGEVEENQINYERFVEILNLELIGQTPQQKKFFIKWAEKMFDRMEEKTVSQALQSIEVYKKLLLAKKIDSILLPSVLDLLASGVEERE